MQFQVQRVCAARRQKWPRTEIHMVTSHTNPFAVLHTPDIVQGARSAGGTEAKEQPHQNEQQRVASCIERRLRKVGGSHVRDLDCSWAPAVRDLSVAGAALAQCWASAARDLSEAQTALA